MNIVGGSILGSGARSSARGLEACDASVGEYSACARLLMSGKRSRCSRGAGPLALPALQRLGPYRIRWLAEIAARKEARYESGS